MAKTEAGSLSILVQMGLLARAPAMDQPLAIHPKDAAPRRRRLTVR